MFDVGVGIDLCEIARMEPLLNKPHFLSRILTEGERSYLQSRGSMAASSLAAMFAAKEALLKAVGLGIRLPLNEIEIVHAPGGQPGYRLHGSALEACPGLFRLSLTHEAGLAAAVCIRVTNDAEQSPAV